MTPDFMEQFEYFSRKRDCFSTFLQIYWLWKSYKFAKRILVTCLCIDGDCF